MRYLIILFLIACGAAANLSADEIPSSIIERDGMTHLMKLMNLKLSDLTFRNDYSEIDSFRLAIIYDLTENPYGMAEFAESLASDCRTDNPAIIIESAFQNLQRKIQPERRYAVMGPDSGNPLGNFATFYNSMVFNRLLSLVNDYLYYNIPASFDSAMALIGKDQQSFLIHEFRETVLEDTADENKSAEVLDSLQKIEEKYIERFKTFGDKIRKDFFLDAGVRTSVMIFREVERIQAEIEAGSFVVKQALADTVVRPKPSGLTNYLGARKEWAIGGSGNDSYRGDYHFIIDFGGNDYYELEYNPEQPHSTIIIDLSGNDNYVSKSDYTLGSGFMSVGLLYDMGGDDIYNGGNFSNGSGFFGFGMLYDRSGSDKYYGDTHTEGAATCGIGMILDHGGSDLYSAAIGAQGYGSADGFGLIADNSGNDNYLTGGKYKAIIHYDDHYLSISQGYGGGLMPFISGGIGGIIDLDGNDNYISDMIAQGCGWWYGFGFIYDSGGNDQYLAYQYAQGNAEHMGLGILIDENGQDFYRGKGLMQGVGHDYSCGILIDRNGSDIYQADDLSQGAGSANGFGILMDDRGDDAYYVKKTINTQGYGNPRRDFGSIGLFLDLGGDDIYDGNGSNNYYWKTDSKWGGGFDLEFIIQDDTISQGTE